MTKKEIQKAMHDESGKILSMLLYAFEDQYKGILKTMDKNPDMFVTHSKSEYKALMVQCCMGVLVRFISEYPEYFYRTEYGTTPDNKEEAKFTPKSN